MEDGAALSVVGLYTNLSSSSSAVAAIWLLLLLDGDGDIISRINY